MPLYSFEFNGQVKDIYFNMNDNKVYIDEQGNEWKRLWNYAPSYSIDNKLDANDSKSFLKYTSSRKGTLGDILDLSAECSEKRAGQSKQDPIKQKFYENYKVKRKGVEHFEVIKAKSKEKLKKLGITITD